MKASAVYLHRVRFTAPSLESYAKKIKMVELDLEMATSEEEKRKLQEKKTSLTWRGLRLASKKQLSGFDRVQPFTNLDNLLRKNQPAKTTEAAGEDHGPEDKGKVPQEQHPSVEEQRADRGSQVTDAAE